MTHRGANGRAAEIARHGGAGRPRKDRGGERPGGRRQASADQGPAQLLPAPGEPALDRADRATQPAGRLDLAESLEVAQDDRRAISLWQACQLVVDRRAEIGVGREELDELTALRWEQYLSALADDRAFQRRYQVPVEIPRRKGAVVVDADEGVRPRQPEVIAALPPAAPDARHSFATQTHPADGCAGAVVSTVERAREISGEGVARILGVGFARVAKSRMPQAPVPAALSALAAADRSIADVRAVTTHNPFAVNDLYLARETGIAVADMNAHGCSLVFGHPQGPTGLRAIAELIEALRLRGGGVGLFTGCAAGDTGAALVLEVTD